MGRGITVVGGTDVTISNNIVRDVQVSAGILVAQEDSYRTYGVSDVRVGTTWCRRSRPRPAGPIRAR